MGSRRCMSVALGFSLALAACRHAVQPGPTDTRPAALAPADVMLVYRTRGGLCAGGMCKSELTIKRDGSFASDEGGAGRIDASLADAVAEEIARADFEAITSKKFTGTCPMAYDGSELVYELHVPGRTVLIESCKIAIDPKAPLFVKADAAIRAAANAK